MKLLGKDSDKRLVPRRRALPPRTDFV